ncbi:beta,beta-carotene 15,15'-dioxygenase-like [Argopecten irradians]|uniref:beta,beta-carotene 15,15'-dioxygenase-like n=1 Tax=Argopecten irradians TaxID=31199 RepID=UPI00372450C6
MAYCHRVESCLRGTSKDKHEIPDKGFENMYRTNSKELEDVSIHFDKPIPEWIVGTLIRNGPGQFEVGKRRLTHMFDGFGKLYKWHFEGNGTVLFSTKFLRTGFYKKSISHHDISPYITFGPTEPRFSYMQVLLALWRRGDNMNVNVYNLPSEDKRGSYVALNDVWDNYEIDPASLDTIGYEFPKVPSFGGISSYMFKHTMSTSHPLPEYGTPNHLTFLVSQAVAPGVSHRVSLIRIKSMSEREVVAQWALPPDEVPYMHSFSVTPKYAILFSPPIFVDTKSLLVSGFVSKGLKWRGTKKNTTVHVIEIKSGTIRKFNVPPIFYLHHINAFEKKGNKIVVDLPTYTDPAFVFRMSLETLLNRTERNKLNVHSTLKRYVIDLERNKVRVRKFPTSAKYPAANKFDMPIINEKYRSLKYCYAYGLVAKFDNRQYSRTALVKKDLCGNGKDRVWFIPNHYPAEAWFIPFPANHTYMYGNEDSGYLLAPVLDGERNASYLAIIDASTMTTFSKAYLPTRVPLTFHGRFFPVN